VREDQKQLLTKSTVDSIVIQLDVSLREATDQYGIWLIKSTFNFFFFSFVIRSTVFFFHSDSRRLIRIPASRIRETNPAKHQPNQ
jgi:hypothetical protein